MCPFNISFYAHVPLKFLMTKRLRKITIFFYQYKHIMILKTFTDVDLCINTSISKWIICKHNFSLLLLILNVAFQIGKSIPRGTCSLPQFVNPWFRMRGQLRLGFWAGVTKILKTRSYFLVQIHAKGYQLNTQTFQIKISNVGWR